MNSKVDESFNTNEEDEESKKESLSWTKIGVYVAIVGIIVVLILTFLSKS